MVRRGRRRRRRPRRRQTMRRKFSGGRVRGRQHPTPSTATPWNSLACMSYLSTSTDKGQFAIDVDAVIKLVQSEIGLGSTNIHLKVRRIDIWTPPNISATNKNCIVFAPCDFTRGASQDPNPIIEWFEAWGTAAQPAHLHYVWPKPMANIILTAGDKSKFGITWEREDSTTARRYLVKMHVLWRCANSSLNATVSGAFESIRQVGFGNHSGQITSGEDDWQIMEGAPDIGSLSVNGV